MKKTTSKTEKNAKHQRTLEFIASLELEGIYLDKETRAKFEEFDNSDISPEEALDRLYSECNKQFNTNIRKPKE